MFLSIPPKLSLSDVMQRIKGRSSRRIQMEFPELRKELCLNLGDGVPSGGAGFIEVIDFNAVIELYALDNFWQLIFSFQSQPFF